MSRNHLFLILALALVLLLGACSSGGGTTTPAPGGTLNPEELVPEVQVQVVDHQFRQAGESDEALNIDPIPGIIAAARTSLDVALPLLNRQEVVQQFLAAANRGVQVRIVTEKGYFDDPAYKPFFDQLEDVTKNAGNIQVHTDTEGFPRLMHSRFLIVDQSRVVTGSYTWESADFDHTFGDVVSILNTNVAAAFTNQFNQMFSESNFGVRKRDDTQHVFPVGNGQGTLEVYFGPTDRLRDQIVSKISSSSNLHVAIQQFSDTTLANEFNKWVGGVDNGSTDVSRRLFLFINNGGVLGDSDDNVIFNAFQDEARNGTTAGELVLGSFGIDPDDFMTLATGSIWSVDGDHMTDILADFVRSGVQPGDQIINTSKGNQATVVTVDSSTQLTLTAAIGGQFDSYLIRRRATVTQIDLSEYGLRDTMNHKLVMFDNPPGIIDTTANFTSMGLTQNDEVMLIMDGQPLVNKYIRGPRTEMENNVQITRWGLDLLPGYTDGQLDPSNNVFPDELRSVQDIQEFDSLLAMFPNISSRTGIASNHRDLTVVPSGIIYGTIPNFKRKVQIPAADQGGDPTTAVIDISFEVFGTTYTGRIFGLDNENQDGTRDPDVDPPPFPLTADFDNNETTNPNHRFILVVPAGTVTLRSIVTDTDGAADARFSTSEKPIVIGPGGVRQVVLNVNLSPNIANSGN